MNCSTAVTPVYSCTGFRLLTEAEWEYSARAGTTTALWSSNGGGELPSNYGGGTTTLTNGFNLLNYGWYGPTANSSVHGYGTKIVASLMPNDYGLYDMAGNVWEWNHDRFVQSHGTTSAIDPVEEVGTWGDYPVGRGGAWGIGPDAMRSARRNSFLSSKRDNDLAFRIGRTN